MNHLTDLANSFNDRIEALRVEITSEIIRLLQKTDYSTLYLTENEDHLSYVVWFDSENSGYDCVVKSVSTDGDNNIELEVCHPSLDILIPVSSADCDMACKNVQWLSDILSSMVYTLTERTTE